MMTVRFASGFSIRYNTASYVIRREAGYTDLYEKKDGRWIAQVPTSGCVIEITPACKVYDAMHDSGEMIDSVVRRVLGREVGNRWNEGKQLAVLKRALASFDARAKCWK
jgi:hypothetical protein